MKKYFVIQLKRLLRIFPPILVVTAILFGCLAVVYDAIASLEEEEGKQGIRAEEGRGTSETYQTHTEVRRGGRRCRGGRRRGREQGERNGAETEGEEIDKAEMEF